VLPDSAAIAKPAQQPLAQKKQKRAATTVVSPKTITKLQLLKPGKTVQWQADRQATRAVPT